MIKKLLIIPFLLFFLSSYAKRKSHSAGDNKIFWSGVQKKMPSFKRVFKKYRDYRFEILFTRVDRNLFNKPVFTNYHFGDSLSYYYPASVVKLPLAVFALEKIRQFPGAGGGSLLEFDSTAFCNGYSYVNKYFFFKRVEEDMTLENFARINKRDVETLLQLNPGLKKELKKGDFVRIYKNKMLPSLRFLLMIMLVYSDNTAYNKLFDFTGPDYINRRFRQLGYKQSRIIRRFAVCDKEEHRITRAYKIIDEQSERILVLENEKKHEAHSELLMRGINVGRRQSDGETVTRGARNFGDHNFIPLQELHRFMTELVFQREFNHFSLHESDWSSLMKYLGIYPSEITYTFDTTGRDQYDGVTNYLFTGNEKISSASGRIINIVGLAYGFATDCAYYFDPSDGTEFFLSCRIYTNRDNTLGNDKYEYHTLAFPLMKELGQTIISIEKSRKKEVLPTFHELRSVFEN